MACEVPPNTKTKKPAVARVSAEFGVTSHTDIQVSADPKGYLTIQHARQSPRRQKQRSQQWPEYPQSSGSTSHTDIQTVPQKHKRNTTTGSPSIRRSRDLPQTPTCRNVETKEKKQIPVYRQVPQPKKRTNTKRQHEYPQTPLCLRGRHTGKSKKAKERCPKRKQEPTKAGQSIHRPRGLPQRPTYRTVTPRGRRHRAAALKYLEFPKSHPSLWEE